jgi:hypothetical protein
MDAKAIERVKQLGKIPLGFELIFDTNHPING